MSLPPDVLIDRLVAAYNRKDLRDLIDCFAHDVEVYLLGGNDPVMHGASDLHRVYAKAFADNPLLHATIESRMALADVVVDKERISSGATTGSLESIVIYKIANGRIAQVYYSQL